MHLQNTQSLLHILNCIWRWKEDGKQLETDVKNILV